jgi:arylsulfatase A-like enzyme
LEHSDQPNVVVILFDKCLRDAIGAYGLKDVHTPNIDRLAQSGVLFSSCYTPQSLCGPARASILTGKHPHTHGLNRNVYPHSEWAGHPNVFADAIANPFDDSRFDLWDNFPFLLHNAGYRTAHIGKWHLGMGNPGFFDRWMSFNSGLPHWIGAPHESAYRPDVHTDIGIEFIEENAGRPFFLYQSYYAPHEPLDPPKRFLQLYEDSGIEPAAYYAAVSNLDWNIGRLLAALEQQDLLDRTLITLTADHGRCWESVRPGTGSGGQLSIPYDEVARVPLIMRYPALLPEGVTWQSGVSLVDLMPTILDIVGVHGRASKSPRLQSFDGSVDPAQRSLLPDLSSGQDVWRRPIVMQNIAMTALDGSLFEDRALRTEKWKLILRKFAVGMHPPQLLCELYDMQADPGETRSLSDSADHSATIACLADQLRVWGKEQQDPLAVELAADCLQRMENAT